MNRCPECQDTGASFAEADDGSLVTDACRRCVALAEIQWETLRAIREAGL